MHLTDEGLEALAARFSPGRHPKVAAALAELKEFRSGERQRYVDLLLDATATALADGLAEEVKRRASAGELLSAAPNGSEAR